jgi:hypothetical protein
MGTYRNAKLEGTGSLTSYQILYTCPAGTSAMIGSMMIANRGDGTTPADIIRIAFSSGSSPNNENFVAYDVKVPNLDTMTISAPMSLNANENILVSSNSTDVSFHANVFEV